LRSARALPLALELAAARVRVLSVEQLLDRLGQRLDVLKGGRGVDERQQTLRATIEWSHDLLDPDERRLFAALAVFAGGCTLEAAEQVCGADIDVLQSLVDKSLVRARQSGRFWMLETIRQFAAEGLARCNDQEPLRRRHAEYFITLAESANLSQYAEGGEARQELLAGEQPNVRAVLEWALERREADLGARMALAVQQLWAAGQPAEGIRWFDRFLAFDDLSDKLRARALCSAGGMADHDSQRELAHRRYLESLAVYRQLDDEDGLAFVLMHLGHSYWYQGDPEAARGAAQESLEICRRRGLRRQESQVLGLLGDLEFEGGDPAVGFELLEQATDMAASAGYPWWQARMLLRRCSAHARVRHDGAG
jgi:tetratricopeptide (TPR) repeat protein